MKWKNMEKMLGFYKDSNQATWFNNNDENTDGLGFCNNCNDEIADSDQSAIFHYDDIGLGWNQGMKKRQSWTNRYFPYNAGATATRYGQANVNVDNANHITYTTILCIIRLKDLSTYFKIYH